MVPGGQRRANLSPLLPGLLQMPPIGSMCSIKFGFHFWTEEISFLGMNGDNPLCIRSHVWHYMMEGPTSLDFHHLPTFWLAVGLPGLARRTLVILFTFLSMLWTMIPCLTEQGKPVTEVHKERVLTMKYMLTKSMCTEFMHKEIFVLTVS